MYVNFKAFLRQLQVGGSITERLVSSFTSLNSAALLHITIWPNTVLLNCTEILPPTVSVLWLLVPIRYLFETLNFFVKGTKVILNWWWFYFSFISVQSFEGSFWGHKKMWNWTRKKKFEISTKNRIGSFARILVLPQIWWRKIKMALVLGLWWSFQQVNTCFYGSCLCLDLNCGLLVSEVTTYPTQRYVCHNIVLGIPFWLFAFTYKTL